MSGTSIRTLSGLNLLTSTSKLVCDTTSLAPSPFIEYSALSRLLGPPGSYHIGSAQASMLLGSGGYMLSCGQPARFLQLLSPSLRV